MYSADTALSIPAYRFKGCDAMGIPCLSKIYDFLTINVLFLKCFRHTFYGCSDLIKSQFSSCHISSYAAFLRGFSSGHKCSYETPQASAMACCIGLDTPTSCTTRDIMAVETPSFMLRSRSLSPLFAAINVLIYKGLFCFFSFLRLDSLIMYRLFTNRAIYVKRKIT